MRKEWDEEKEPEEYTLTGDIPKASDDDDEDGDNGNGEVASPQDPVTAPASTPAKPLTAAATVIDDADDLLISDAPIGNNVTAPSSTTTANAGTKRKQPSDNTSENGSIVANKKAKVDDNNDDDVIELD